jgi:hypothetical protein
MFLKDPIWNQRESTWINMIMEWWRSTQFWCMKFVDVHLEFKSGWWALRKIVGDEQPDSKQIEPLGLTKTWGFQTPRHEDFQPKPMAESDRLAICGNCQILIQSQLYLWWASMICAAYIDTDTVPPVRPINLGSRLGPRAENWYGTSTKNA